MAVDKIATVSFVHTWDDGVDHFYRKNITTIDSGTDEAFDVCPENFDDYSAGGGGGGSQPPIPFVQDADPGAVGAGAIWVDTSSDPPVEKLRNTADDGWITVGGGSAPTSHAAYFCSGTVVAGEVASLTWVKTSGDDLLDLTDPTEPVVPAEGVYAASATAQLATAPLAGPTDKGLVYLYLDAEGVGVSAAGYLDADEAGETFNRASFAITYFIPAAGTLVCQGYATDSAVDLEFGVLVYVQCLS